jgi:nucleotidyltransferase/DNA polymerase involved in DNA repair
LLKDLPIAKLRSLGGLFGEEVQQKLNISTVGELKAVPYPRLDSMFGEKCAMKLARLSVGLDDEEVKRPQLVPYAYCNSKRKRQSHSSDHSPSTQ